MEKKNPKEEEVRMIKILIDLAQATPFSDDSEAINYAIEKIKGSGLAEDIFQWLGDNLGSPCDYSFHDVTPGEYLMEEVPGYCDRFCGKCKDAECWKMYLTSVLNARHDPTNFEVIKNMDDEELSILMEDLTHYDDVDYEWRSKLSPLLPFEDWKDWLNRRAICNIS